VALLNVSVDRSSRALWYETGVLVKRAVRGGWLFAYLQPMVCRERNRDWHPDGGVRVGFDALFRALASAPNQIAGRCDRLMRPVPAANRVGGGKYLYPDQTARRQLKLRGAVIAMLGLVG